jgi:hypothetical protein
MSKSRLIRLFGAFLALLPLVAESGATSKPPAIPDKQGGDRLVTSVIGAAGLSAASSTYRGSGTLGQPGPIGTGLGEGTILRAGFWPSYQRLYWLTDLEWPEMIVNRLLPNYPNPFNPATTIEYVLARSGLVVMEIFDVKGARVRTLVHESKTPGDYQQVWDGCNDQGRQVASGAYFCLLRVDDFSAVVKMLILK